MDGAFVLVVDRRDVPQPRREPAATPAAVDLGFTAQRTSIWSDRAARVRLTTWEGEPGGPGAGSAAQHDGGVSFAVGHLLWGDVTTPRSARDAQQDLRGVYAALHIDADGDGWVITDRLGLRCLYIGETDDALVISSRAALAAAAMGPTHRDAEGACWLAYTGYRVGESSGFAGVRVLEPGTILLLQQGRPVWDQEAVLEPPADAGVTDVAELAATVADDVACSLRAVLDRDPRPPIVRLTGGKDSRLLLAVALHAGLADELTYETIGYPGLADADIAAELAARFGLSHELRFIGMRPDEPYAERFRRFVASTACLANPWGLDAPMTAGRTTLTGICGEALRSYARVPDGPDAAAAIERTFRADRWNRLGLVRPDVAATLQAELLARLAREPTPGCDPIVRLHAHFAHHRMRFSRLGAREELAGDERAHPLYSPVTLDAAIRMPPADRQSEILVSEVMRLGDPWLVEHRFAGAGWDDRARAHLGLTNTPGRASAQGVASANAEHRATGGAARDPARARAEPLMASIQAAPSDERVAMLAEAFSDDTNPAWEVLDHGRATAALGRYAELTTVERAELFGAAGAALWLGTAGPDETVGQSSRP